jgi:hypothetical protein
MSTSKPTRAAALKERLRQFADAAEMIRQDRPFIVMGAGPYWKPDPWKQWPWR